MNETKTLLQKAKSVKTIKSRLKKLPDGMEEAALAWCRDEVTLTQIARAMDLNNTGTRMYCMVALALKEYLNKNFRVGNAYPKK